MIGTRLWAAISHLGKAAWQGPFVMGMLAIGTLVATAGHAAETRGNAFTLKVNSLADAVRIFSMRHGVITSYEDPLLSYAGDLQDVSTNVNSISRVFGAPKFQPLYTMRSLTLELEYHLETNNLTPDAITLALREILESYNAGDYPGRFTVAATPPVWFVIPTESKHRTGEWRKENPILDRAVQVASTRTNLYGLVFELFDSVDRGESAPRFGFGSNPFGYGVDGRGPVVDIAEGTYALRDLLAEIFTKNFDNIFWQLRNRATERPGFCDLTLNLFEIEVRIDALDQSPPTPPAPPPPMQSRESLLLPKQDANDPRLFHIDVSGERPLRDAIEGFMRLHRVLVTYEDPIYEFMGDMIDRTSERKDLQRYPPGQAPRVLDPRPSHFQAIYTLNTNEPSASNVTAALNQILEQYNRGPRTAEYRLQERPGVWHVVPSRVRDRSGSWKSASNILDGTVFLGGGETNYMYITHSLLQGECQKIGKKLWTFTAVPPQIVKLPEGSMVLRDVFDHLIKENFIDLSWFLLYDPSDPPAGGFALNYFWLPKERLSDPVKHQDGKEWSKP